MSDMRQAESRLSWTASQTIKIELLQIYVIYSLNMEEIFEKAEVSLGCLKKNELFFSVVKAMI